MVRAFASTRFYSPSAGAVPLASTNVPTASESKNHDDEGDYGIQAEVNDSNIENDSGSPVLAPWEGTSPPPPPPEDTTPPALPPVPDSASAPPSVESNETSPPALPPIPDPTSPPPPSVQPDATAPPSIPPLPDTVSPPPDPAAQSPPSPPPETPPPDPAAQSPPSPPPETPPPDVFLPPPNPTVGPPPLPAPELAPPVESPPPLAAPPPVIIPPPQPVETSPPPIVETPPPQALPPQLVPPAAPPTIVSPPAIPPVEAPPPSIASPPPASPPLPGAPPPEPTIAPPPAEALPPPPSGSPPPSVSSPPSLPPSESPPPPPSESPPPPPLPPLSAPASAPKSPTAPPPLLSPLAPPPTSLAPALSIPKITQPDLDTPPPPGRSSGPPSTSPSPPSSGVSSRALVVGGAVGGIVALAVVVCLLIFCCRKRRRRIDGDGFFSQKGSSAAMPLTGAHYKSDNPDAWGIHSGSVNGSDIPPPPSGSDAMGNSRSYFLFSELQEATGNFSKDNLLGEGGFGRVYKGTLQNGTVVAVKQLNLSGAQGEREFRAEVEVISRVHHRHLVSLVGYCVSNQQRLLVYEFVPNGTLENNLHNPDMPVMEWSTRLKIALGCARGLAYLHEDCHPKIIHRDIKSSNILLDENFEAQVADFGLAKLSNDTNTHVSTRVMGTFGYLAPEYAASGKLTDRSDVFSFGVILLELVTGRRPIDTTQEAGFESLVEWARPVVMRILEDGRLEDLVDPNLDGDYDPDEMFRVIETAAACVRHSALKRPRMAQVVRALENDSDRAGLYQGVRPQQNADTDSQYGSESQFGTNRYGGDSGQFDSDDHSTASGLQSFHKQNTNVSRQPNNLAAIQSADHSIIPEESGEFDIENPSNHLPVPDFKPPEFKSPVLGTQQFTSPTIRSGEYDLDNEASDFPGAYRSTSTKQRPGASVPNNGMSGFLGAPPPPPGRYQQPLSYSGEYVPIGKTVHFALSVDEKKF